MSQAVDFNYSYASCVHVQAAPNTQPKLSSTVLYSLGLLLFCRLAFVIRATLYVRRDAKLLHALLGEGADLLRLLGVVAHRIIERFFR